MHGKPVLRFCAGRLGERKPGVHEGRFDPVPLLGQSITERPFQGLDGDPGRVALADGATAGCCGLERLSGSRWTALARADGTGGQPPDPRDI